LNQEQAKKISKENDKEDKQHFLMYCQGYKNLRSKLHSVISKTVAHFVTLSDYDKITYLLNLGKDNTCKFLRKYIH